MTITETEEARPSGTRKRSGSDDTRHRCKPSLLVRSLFSATFQRESDLNTQIQTLDEIAGIAFSRCGHIQDTFYSRPDGLAPTF